jgi:hypothetical protein
MPLSLSLKTPSVQFSPLHTVPITFAGIRIFKSFETRPQTGVVDNVTLEA